VHSRGALLSLGETPLACHHKPVDLFKTSVGWRGYALAQRLCMPTISLNVSPLSAHLHTPCVLLASESLTHTLARIVCLSVTAGTHTLKSARLAKAHTVRRRRRSAHAPTQASAALISRAPLSCACQLRYSSPLSHPHCASCHTLLSPRVQARQSCADTSPVGNYASPSRFGYECLHASSHPF
jgi:hypothetical protein